jgi:hypothetical protein
VPAPIEAFTSHGAVLASVRLRILLAEDDADLRRLLASELAADGYEVEEVADGRQFVAVFDKPFDVDDLRTAVLHLAVNSLVRGSASPVDSVGFPVSSREVLNHCRG